MSSMSNTPLVSVCMNAYNAEKYVYSAIDSVLNQTYTNLQVIVVDDASTDKTPDVIKNSFTDKRLEVYTRNQNRHISYTCNEAINYAKGKYIFHIDSDDVVLEDIIEKEVAYLESHENVAACFTRPEIIDLDGSIADSSFDDIRALFVFEEKTQAEFVYHFFYNLNCLFHTGSMVRKSVLDEIGLHDYSMSYLHDFDLWTRIIIKYPIFVFEEPLALYRMGKGINHSNLNKDSAKIFGFEAACAVYRMIDNCPDDLFLEAFSEKLILKGQHTHEEAELEKAFLLLNVNCMPHDNRLLGLVKLKQLFGEKKYVDLALEKFNFGIYDLLEYEKQQQFYDLAEVDGYLDKIKELKTLVKDLKKQNAECIKALNHSDKAVRRTIEYQIYAALKKSFYAFKHIHSFLFIQNDGVKYKKKVFLYGFYGMNFGDDLFFETIINRYPDVLFIVLLNPEYGKFFKKFKNVKFYSYSSKLVSVLNKSGSIIGIHDVFEHLLLSKCDAIVHIGGSIYQQTEDYLADYKMRKRRINKRYFSLSSNFGPYYSEDFYKLWKKTLGKGYDICFRDKYSSELFGDLENVRYAPDLLFSFKKKTNNVISGSVSISVIDPCYKYRDFSDDEANCYKKSIVNTVTALVKEKRTVNLLGFCKYEGDDKFIEQILDEIPDYLKKYVNVLNYEFKNKNEMIKKLASSEYIIGTRLHSIIFGLSMGKKVLPIVYDNKVSNILSDINYTGETVYLKSMADYRDTGLKDLLDRVTVFDVSHLSNADDLQFEKLDKFLKD